MIYAALHDGDGSVFKGVNVIGHDRHKPNVAECTASVPGINTHV